MAGRYAFELSVRSLEFEVTVIYEAGRFKRQLEATLEQSLKLSQMKLQPSGTKKTRTESHLLNKTVKIRTEFLVHFVD